MKDKECSESENVTFEVDVSHPGIDAFWTFNGQPLKSGIKYKMESKDKGHTLTIINAMKDEEGEYMFAAGEQTCSATLTVSGMFTWYSPLSANCCLHQLTNATVGPQGAPSRSLCVIC